ncbi:MAG TPA: hypothetical protein VLL95_09510 [Phnomibacter sp.]|nr:hypothetical protein [Phnomibacter sp.]
MKRMACLMVVALMSLSYGKAQTSDSADAKSWSVNASLGIILFPEDVFLMPIVVADKGKLHLVSRYNYEDLNTFSLFGGYNFTGGKKLQYRITPMLGFVVGNTDSIAPGLEVDLSLGKFRFYTEDEYVFEFNDKANSFFYSWSELSFAPKEWFWFGISWQRLRPYQSDRVVEKGFTAGFAFNRFAVQGYYFNPGSETQFGIVNLSVSF